MARFDYTHVSLLRLKRLVLRNKILELGLLANPKRYQLALIAGGHGGQR